MKEPSGSDELSPAAVHAACPVDDASSSQRSRYVFADFVSLGCSLSRDENACPFSGETKL